jgi:hypothetical protein
VKVKLDKLSVGQLDKEIVVMDIIAKLFKQMTLTGAVQGIREHCHA